MLRNIKRIKPICSYFGLLWRKRRSQVIRLLRDLNAVNRAVFACFLQSDYPHRIYFFERRLHFAKTKFMSGVVKLRAAHQHEKQLAALFDILLDCAQLRRRVSDHTVFSLCASELRAVSTALSQLFAALESKQSGVDTRVLAASIERFEENYLHVLRVTAREPLAFLLFINGLKALLAEVMASD